MLHHFDLIVFDWDGTLMDSTARIVSSMQVAAKLAGLPAPDKQSVAGVIGLSLNTAFDSLFGERLDEALRAKLTTYYRQQFLVDNLEPMPLFSGVESLIALLNQKGKQLAVATGKSRKGLDRVFVQTGLGKFFHGSICADEASSKPDPDMLHKLLLQFDVSPQRTLMIGDTDYDLLMAKNAGVTAIGCTYGAQSYTRLQSHPHLALVSTIDELSALLQAN